MRLGKAIIPARLRFSLDFYMLQAYATANLQAHKEG